VSCTNAGECGIALNESPVEQQFGGITFVKIEADSFTFGSSITQPDRLSNESQHVIPLDHTFWISKYEISQGEWFNVMGTNPSTYQQPGPDMSAPVETVTWYQAQEFTNQLNQQIGGAHFRLPTESEWVYVAKAGTYTIWSFGNDLQSLSSHTHIDGQSHPRIRGLKSPNLWGVYDLYGNVNEWCADWYDAVAQSQNGGCPPETGTYKVIRGGSNGSAPKWLRSSSRNFALPDRKGYYIGLRLVYVEDPQLDPFKPGGACSTP